jgi:hypothetical protein
MGKIIDLNNLGIGTSFDFQRKTLDLIVDTVKRLRYCDGVTDGDYKTTLKYFREQVTKVGISNTITVSKPFHSIYY